MAIKLMPSEYDSEQKGKFGLLKSKSALFEQFEPRANLFLTIFLILLILIIGASIGLYLYKIYLNEQVNLVVNQIQEINNQRDTELENSLIELDQGIKKISKVLQERIYPLNILIILEELALPDVSFSDFNSDLVQAKIDFKVEAKNYQKLAEQMVVFEKDSRIEKVDFSGINLGETGRASASFAIDLDADLLRNE